jgi:hypothetical protein
MGRLQNHQNLNTEESGVQILLNNVNGFYVPSSDEKRFLYDLCGIEYKKYYKSIDGIVLKVKTVSDVKSSDDFLLIEVKNTKSPSVTKLPYGMFFGFTKNEEDLFKSMDNYRLCFVHAVLKEYCFLTFDEYQGMIQNKRIQYQINFKSK